MPRIFVKIALLCISITLSSCRGSNEVNQKESPTSQTTTHTPQSTSNETDEQKAVRMAEHFVSINGYTTAEPDRNNLSRESFEFYGGDELLKMRRNSLQPKAYGIAREQSWKKPGWTVVFLYTKHRGGLRNNEMGRAVTMDENFENLRVEHEDFFLKDVDLKF